MDLDSATIAAIEASGKRLFARVYRQARAEAAKEVKAIFGMAFRGGKVQWPFLQQGHGYELTQHGTYTFTTTNLPANTDSSSVPVTYPLAYAAGVVPDVQATAQDVGAGGGNITWVATAAPTSGFEQQKIDLGLCRRIPLSTPQTGSQSLTILAGTHSVTGSAITIPIAYGTAPLVLCFVDDPDYVATAVSTATTITITLAYRPVVAAGTVASNTTGVTNQNAGASIANNPNWTGVGGADGVGGAGTTGSSGTGSTSTNSNTHQHTENTAASYTQNATTSANGAGANHSHTGPSHTHSVADAQHSHSMVNISHTHTVTDPGHTHTFSGSAQNVGSDTTKTVQWVSFGVRTAPATTVKVSWQATGVQAG